MHITTDLMKLVNIKAKIMPKLPVPALVYIVYCIMFACLGFIIRNQWRDFIVLLYLCTHCKVLRQTS